MLEVYEELTIKGEKTNWKLQDKYALSLAVALLSRHMTCPIWPEADNSKPHSF